MPQYVDKVVPSTTYSPDFTHTREPSSPGLFKTVGAAIRQENDVYNAIDFVTKRHNFEYDPNFKLVDTLEARGEWDNRLSYVGVQSMEEFNVRKAQIDRENADRETLAAAGWGGYAAMVGSGMISPTIFMPLIRSGTGVKSLLTGALSVGAGAAAQEAVLFANQYTRTGEEAAYSIGASTILGGILGAAAHYMSKAEFDKAVFDMANPPREEAISPAIGGTESTSAAIPRTDAGRLKTSGLNYLLGWQSPVTRGIEQANAPAHVAAGGGSKLIRWATAMFSQGGLELEGNARGIAAAPGGNIESLIKTYAADSYMAAKAVDSAYAEYVFGKGNEPAFFSKTRSMIKGALAEGKMNFEDFKAEVAHALRDAMENTPAKEYDPLVLKAAKEVDKYVFKKLYDEGVSAGVFSGEEKLVGDRGYLTRIYDHPTIKANFNQFVDILSANYNKQLQGDYQIAWQKLMQSMAKDKNFLEDYNLPADVANTRRKELLETLKAMEEGLDEDVKAGELQMSALREEAQALKAEALKLQTEGKLTEAAAKRAAAKQKLEEAKTTKTALGPDFEKYLGEKSAIRERINNLNKARAVVDERFNAKLDKIERNEELQIGTILRAQKQLQKFVDFLKKGKPELVEEELTRLKNLFESDAEKFNTIEARLRELEQSGYDGSGPVEVTTLKGKAEKVPDEVLHRAGLTPWEIDDYKRSGKYADKAEQAQKGYTWIAGSWRQVTDQDIDNAIIGAEHIRTVVAPKMLDRIERMYAGHAPEDKLANTLGSDSAAMTKADAIKRVERDITKAEARIEIMRNQQKMAQDAAATEASAGKSVDHIAPEIKLGDQLDAIAAKLDARAEKIGELDAFDHAAWVAEVEQMMRDLAETHAQVNARRAVRAERLLEAAKKLSPEEQAKMFEARVAKMKARPGAFRDLWNQRGASQESDLIAGKADFTEKAKEAAQATANKILGTERRLAYSDLIQMERGPELARVLNIPSNEIAQFLENDIEKLVAVYTRTVGADIVLARKFGKANMEDVFKELTDEKDKAVDAIRHLKDKQGKPLTPEAQQKLQFKTHQFYEDARHDLEVLLERARGIRGIPKDPGSISARMARSAMQLNTLRMMGGVVLASISDPARVVMKYGLKRTFRDGVMPMIRNLKLARVSQREAQLAGTALDLVMHTRMHQITDVFDDAFRGTIIERGLQVGTSRLGMVALFDQWNSAWKQFAGGVANAKLLDSIRLVMEGGGKKEVAAATDYLARVNIDGTLAETIWREVTNGKGGGKVDGIWLPNTEDWNILDPEVARAQRAYRAALVQDIDDTIVTPGFEKPNWTDSGLPGKLIAQFKSFGLSSTQKTLMAGLQAHDAAFVNGMMISLALGGISYYLASMASGGDAQTEMENAGPDKWIDEMISRSGLIGVFDEGQRIAQRIPMLQRFASFSGTRSSRREGGDLVSELMGPTYDLLTKGSSVLAGVDEPTKQTLHQLRQMLPFQNLWYLRRLLTQIEESSGLPERRAK